jgi:hypothetical protein
MSTKIVEIYDNKDVNPDEISDEEYLKLKNKTYLDPMFKNGILRESIHELIRYLDHEDIKYNEDFDMIRKLYPYAVLGNITSKEYIKLLTPIFPLAKKHLDEGDDEIYSCWMNVKQSLATLPIYKGK